MRRHRRRRGRHFSGMFEFSEEENIGIDIETAMMEFTGRLITARNLDNELLHFALEFMSAENMKAIADELGLKEDARVEKKRYRYHDRESTLADVIGNAPQFADFLDEQLESNELPGGASALSALLSKSLLDAAAERPDPMEKAGNLLDKLAKVFRLEEAALSILVFLYSLEMSREFNSLFISSNGLDFVRAIARATDLSISAVNQAFASRSPLVTSGIVEIHSSIYESTPDLNPMVLDYLSGMTEKPLQERFIRESSDPVHALDSYGIAEERKDIINRMLKAKPPVNILFHGRPGTGKTELARSIAAASGKKAFFVNYGEDDGHPRRSNNWKLAVQVAADSAVRDDAVLIIDEADFILNTSKSFSFFGLFSGAAGGGEEGKGWLNNFLDNSGARIIWITNSVEGMDRSNQRRFAYNLSFQDFSRQQRLAIWEQLVKKHSLKKRFSRKRLRELAARFPVNAGGVAASLEGLTRIYSEQAPGTIDDEHFASSLEELLDRQLALQGKQRLNNQIIPDRKYDPDALNVDVDINRLLSGLKNFTRRAESSSGKSGLRQAMLFEGLPGTGKTAMAGYLAEELGRDLIIRRASDLIDPFVGMTEKRIRNTFEEATQSNAILFIDEADTFLGSRKDAHRSWERSLVNEFLSGMENFSGILICCTNFLDKFDEASLRRFHWKIHFRPLDAQGKTRLYKKYFQPQGGRLASQIQETLRELDPLTPGDFRAVHDRLAWTVAAETPESAAGENSAGDDSLLPLEELKREVRYKEKGYNRVGFQKG